MPNHGEVPKRSLIEEVLRHVAGLTIVDDGSEETVARGVESLARTLGAGFVRLPVRQGKAPHYEPASMQSANRHPKPKRSSDRCGWPAPCDSDPCLRHRSFDGGARDRRPLRRPGVNAVATPAGKPCQPASARAEHRPLGSGHAVWDATPTRPGARAAAPGGRLRGGDPTPQGGARGRPRRRLGPYPRDLRRREELVSRTSRFRTRPRSTPAVHRTTNTVAQPTAIPNRLPTSTSDQ